MTINPERRALVQNGVVVQVVLEPSGYVAPDGMEIGPPGGNVGDRLIGGVYVPPDPDPPTLQDYDDAVQSHIDSAAYLRGYRDAASCVSYVGSTNPTWDAEAVTFRSWRDDVWVYAFTVLGQVQSGQIPAPTIAEFIADLPHITWGSA